MNTNNTTTITFSLEIPKADTSLLKSLVKRMGGQYIKLQLSTPLTNRHLMTRSKGVSMSMSVQMNYFPN